MRGFVHRKHDVVVYIYFNVTYVHNHDLGRKKLPFVLINNHHFDCCRSLTVSYTHFTHKSKLATVLTLFSCCCCCCLFNEGMHIPWQTADNVISHSSVEPSIKIKGEMRCCQLPSICNLHKKLHLMFHTNEHLLANWRRSIYFGCDVVLYIGER